MKFDLYNQFTPTERALLLLNKYPLDYLKELINGLISKSRKNNEMAICTYWNEVAIEVKRIINGK